jgi:hypothetical protein
MQLFAIWATVDAGACVIMAALAVAGTWSAVYTDNLGQRIGLFSVTLYAVLHGFEVAATGRTSVAAVGISLGLVAFGCGTAARVIARQSLRHQIERDRAELARLSSMRMDLDAHVSAQA